MPHPARWSEGSLAIIATTTLANGKPDYVQALGRVAEVKCAASAFEILCASSVDILNGSSSLPPDVVALVRRTIAHVFSPTRLTALRLDEASETAAAAANGVAGPSGLNGG